MAVIKMLLLIGLLIFVHEFGHFIVARMFKIKVTRFCLGLPFGPTIWEKKIGDITYGVHWFLFGGYVSFPDDEKDLNLPADSPELFRNAPIYQRACVLVAGVTANVVTAYLLILFCCLWWHQLPMGQYNLFTDSIDKSAPVTTVASGLKAGDRFVSINGRDIVYPNELKIVATMSKKFDNKITEEQYNKVLAKILEFNPNYNKDTILHKGDIIKLPKPVLEDKVVASEIEVFNLKSKKKYIDLNESQQEIRNKAYGKDGVRIKSDIPLKTLVEAVSDTYAPIDIVIERNGEKIALPTLYSGTEGILGIVTSAEEKYLTTNTLKEAIIATNDYMVRNTVMMIWSFKLLVVGQVPLNQVRGVVAITKIGADVIKSSLLRGFLLTAIISLNLAILNLLPIPALDGGHLMFLIIEKIKGSPVDEKFIEICSTIFFGLLIALTIFIVGHDVWILWFAK